MIWLITKCDMMILISIFKCSINVGKKLPDLLKTKFESIFAT